MPFGDSELELPTKRACDGSNQDGTSQGQLLSHCIIFGSTSTSNHYFLKFTFYKSVTTCPGTLLDNFRPACLPPCVQLKEISFIVGSKSSLKRWPLRWRKSMVEGLNHTRRNANHLFVQVFQKNDLFASQRCKSPPERPGPCRCQSQSLKM